MKLALLMIVLAAMGGFVAGMLWIGGAGYLDPVGAYCRGNVEGYAMAGTVIPPLATMEESEVNCVANIGDGAYDFEGFGFRGPLVP